MTINRIESKIDCTFLVRLDKLKESELSSVGAKALRLGELIRYGYEVPTGICIRSEAYRQFMSQNIPEGLLQEVLRHINNGYLEAARRSSTKIVERMMLAPIPQALLMELRTVLSLSQAADGLGWSVRSSASEEDTDTESFAGLYSTFLNVIGEAALLEKIKLCWASLWNNEAMAYRVKVGITKAPAMAVILQRMVTGEYSGVLFTANPHSGCTTEICINVANGLNESLVSGKVTPDFYRISKVRGDVLEQRLQSADSVLTKKVLTQLLKIALDVEKLYGCPQDIEWTINKGKINMLQTRPITRLPNYFPLSDPLLARKALKIAYVGLFSPFGATLEMEKNTVYCQAMQRLTGKRTDHIQFLINGYIYEYREVGYPFAGFAWLIARTKLLWKTLHPRQSERYFLERIQEPYLRTVEELEESIQQEKTISGLLTLLDRAIQNYYEFQRKSISVGWLADWFSIMLRRFVRYLTPVRSSDASIFEMIKGFKSYTHYREHELTELEATARRDERLRSFFERCTAEEFTQRLLEQSLPSEFLEYFKAFSKNYEYVWTSNNPKDAGWQLDYQIFLEYFRKSATNQKNATTSSCQREPFLEKIRKVLNSNKVEQVLPVRRFVLDFLIEHSRRFLPYRENRNHLFYRGVLSIRRIMLSLGKMLVEYGELSRPEDIFFLTLEEVRNLPQWLGGVQTEAFRVKIKKRIEEYHANQFLIPPSTVSVKNKMSTPSWVRVEGDRILKGIACSNGVYRGKVRIIFSKSQLHNLKRGDVLVCVKARPFFSSLFGIAGALITEEGGMLSHGAILAREYGIPAVLNVPSATRVIQDGNIVTVDGERGEIVIHSSGRRARSS